MPNAERRSTKCHMQDVEGRMADAQGMIFSFLFSWCLNSREFVLR